MKSKQFLAEIRSISGLQRAVLRKIEVTGTRAEFHLVTDSNYTREDVAGANAVAARYVPVGWSAGVKVVKSVPSAEGVRRAAAEFLAVRFPAVAAFISPEDIEVVCDNGGGRFFIGADETEQAQFRSDGALDALNAYLQRTFCGTWYGEMRFCGKQRGEIEGEALPPAEVVLAPRTFEIANYSAIDGAAPQVATYIADLTKEMAGVTVCGTLSYIEERQTKNGKPFFSLTLSDGTGSLRCAYFSKKATLEKARGLKQGDSLCLTGDNELFNGALSFRVRMLDYGALPEGFVPEARPSRPVPAQYVAVFPVPDADFVQGAMFGEAGLPEEFIKSKFVVFDLETTGLNEGGVMDRIIEIGAVKIENGRICERFSSFVACPVRLPERIIEITGITDDMLVGAPEVGAVMADFYRFCDGCELVGHNVQFDSKFIRHYGEKEGFRFDHKQYDTIPFAQALLRLSNYKLNTVADHFGFTFNHHRAYDDAFVTAKIFIELVKQKGGLPK